MEHIRVIAFDADDTLWHNETRFQDVQARLSRILDRYAPHDQVQARLHDTEVRNIRLFGYGVKGFTLSMVETAIEISNQRIDAGDIHQIVMMGKELLDAPMELLPDVRTVLEQLGRCFPLYLITKGDVLDQRNKIEKSGLASLFRRTEVVQEKDEATYAALFADLSVSAAEVAMVGNSIKSDVLPVLALGGTAVHIPYEVTASFEQHEDEVEHPKYHAAKSLSELPDLFGVGED